MIFKRGGDMVFDVKYRLLVVVESNNVQYSTVCVCLERTLGESVQCQCCGSERLLFGSGSLIKN